MGVRVWFAGLALLIVVACGPNESKSAAETSVDIPSGMVLAAPEPKLAEVRAIREDIFRRVAGASESGFRGFEYPANMDDQTWLARTLSEFDENDYGVWCYDNASLLAAAYRIRGYEAVNVSFGIEGGGLTHAAALVKVDGDWFYEDAYFNFEIPVPFFDAVRSVRRGEPLPVTVGADLTRPIRVTKASEAAFFGQSPNCEPKGDAIQCDVKFSSKPYLELPLWTSTFQRQAKLGVQGNLAGLFLFPFAVYDGKGYYRDHQLLEQYESASGCVGGAEPACSAIAR